MPRCRGARTPSGDRSFPRELAMPRCPYSARRAFEHRCSRPRMMLPAKPRGGGPLGRTRARGRGRDARPARSSRSARSSTSLQCARSPRRAGARRDLCRASAKDEVRQPRRRACSCVCGSEHASLARVGVRRAARRVPCRAARRTRPASPGGPLVSIVYSNSSRMRCFAAGTCSGATSTSTAANGPKNASSVRRLAPDM